MIYCSILAKTYAWVLGTAHPTLAFALWLVGLGADLKVFYPPGGAPAGQRWAFMRSVLLVQAGTLLAGWGLQDLWAQVTLRWKDGLPMVPFLASLLLSACRLPATAFQGDLYLTTMAGPLRHALSLDHLGLLLPAWVAAFFGIFWLQNAVSWAQVVRGMSRVLGGLILIALLRSVLSLSLFVALSDFISYESEELPWGLFVKPATVAGLYLPFFLAGWRWFSQSAPPTGMAPALARSAKGPGPVPGLVWCVIGLLALAAFWEPRGRLKQGEVIINTFHTQWSRTDRPYDRSWYGADSGYNYACLKRWFEVFYRVRELKTRLRMEDLEQASVLIIYVPDQPFSEDELRTIELFVRRGGGLLLIGDHTNVFGSTSHLNEIARYFGFGFRDDVLFDQDEDFFQLFDVPPLAPAALHGMSFFKFRGPTSIEPASWFTRSVIALDHAKGFRAIYSVNNFYPPPHDHPSMTSGRYGVAATSRFGQGRVAAFADSTVFSNFEIFYPGKYEYLLNTVHWLNHADHALTAFGKRCVLILVLGGIVFQLYRARTPRRVLTQALLAMALLYGAYYSAAALELRRAHFPVPLQPSRSLFFLAPADDPAYGLRAFTTDAPYHQRFDVFIQWVLRTGAFAGFYVDDPKGNHQLFEHLGRFPEDQVGLAMIVQSTNQIVRLRQLARQSSFAQRPLLLMFSRRLDWNRVSEVLRIPGLRTKEIPLDQAQSGWPEGEVLLSDLGPRLLLVYGAERYSDEVMGFSEKVVPNEAQRVLFEKAFSLIDRLLPPPPASR